MTDNNTTKVVITAAIPGSIFFGALFFIIGLVIYQDLYLGFMLGLFAWIATIVCPLFLIPVAGPILFGFSTWVWGWPGAIANALSLPSGGAPAAAWFIPTIFTFVIGIIFTIIVVVVIIAAIADN